jgi:hypothetical protein
MLMSIYYIIEPLFRLVQAKDIWVKVQRHKKLATSKTL